MAMGSWEKKIDIRYPTLHAAGTVSQGVSPEIKKKDVATVCGRGESNYQVKRNLEHVRKYKVCVFIFCPHLKKLPLRNSWNAFLPYPLEWGGIIVELS